jgi:predicted ferric reductase
MWYLTRASGIVATVLVVAALLWGLIFSARDTGKRLRPAWWLDLHNWLGGLALSFVGVHIAASVLDSSSGIGLVQAFVPGTAALDTWAIGWGVIASYLLAVVVFTTWPRRLANRRWWRVLHLTSIAATALALLHAYQSGSDATRLAFEVGLFVASTVATYGILIRVISITGRKHSQATHSSGSSASNGAVAEYEREHH